MRVLRSLPRRQAWAAGRAYASTPGHRGVSVLGRVTPASLRRRPLRIPVGELLVLASA